VSLPDGFTCLVEKVLDEDPASSRSLPAAVEEIWRDFAWYAFLDQNRQEAEVNYLYEIVDSAGLLEPATIRRLGMSWGDELTEVCERAIPTTEGRRRGILQAAMNADSVDRARRCVFESVRYFENLSPAAIEERASTPAGTTDLMTEIAYPNSCEHIYNIGITKAVLWLQGYGFANHLCPPSRQALNFVQEDLGIALRPGFGEELGIWSQYFAPFLREIARVSRMVENELGRPVTVRDVGKAIWYYKSCQSLVAMLRKGLKNQLTPRIVCEFADENRWSLHDLAERITDIDEIDNLREQLCNYLSV